MVNWSCLAGNDRRLEVTMTVTADDLDSVISCVMSGLLPITDRDWSVRAGTLEWDCWHTAEHIGDCLMSVRVAARGPAQRPLRPRRGDRREGRSRPKC